MGNINSLLKRDDESAKPEPINKIYVYKLHLKENLDNLTGWERVQRIFETDMYGEKSPELIRCMESVMYTFVVGAIIGGIGRSRISYHNFFRSNMHTAFETPSKAKLKLQETVLMGFGSGAFRIGWRVALFGTIYSVTSTCVTAYRGKPSVFDSSAGGAAAGFLYKIREGPKPTIAGTVLGGLLGLVGGVVTYGAMMLAQVSPDEVIAQNRQEIIERREKALKQLQAQRPPETDRVTMLELQQEILKESDPNTKSSQPSDPNSSKSKPTNVNHLSEEPNAQNDVTLPS